MGVNILEITINVNLVQRLISTQFPQWRDLSIVPVAESAPELKNTLSIKLGSKLMIYFL